jgi:hypothetical protein
VSPAAVFFFAVLATQMLFTGVLVWLVARRFPARLRLYRFVAPAAVPLLLFGIVFAGFYSWAHHEYATGFDTPSLAVLGRIFLAYGVLWLFGVIWASMIARWTRR